MTTAFKSLAIVSLILGSSLALAQPASGPGPGAGPGAGPCAAGASAPAANCPGGGYGPGMMGPGARRPMGPGARAGRDYTPGWGLMSEAERLEHRKQLGEFKSYEECHGYMEGQHATMAARAKERGVTLPAKPRRDACAPLKAAPKK